MAEKIDNYSAFNDVDLSGAKKEGETRSQYKARMKAIKSVMKIYRKVGIEEFKLLFPNGITDKLLEAEAVYNENNSKTSMKKLGEAK